MIGQDKIRTAVTRVNSMVRAIQGILIIIIIIIGIIIVCIIFYGLSDTLFPMN